MSTSANPLLLLRRLSGTARRPCAWAVFLLGLLIFLCIPPAAQAAPPQDPVVHTVRHGETLSSIAAQYGTTVDALMAANNLTNPNLLVVGQRLTIPPATQQSGPALPASETVPAIHRVQPGETLSSIARSYGITAQDLARWNQISDVNHIETGQELRLHLDFGSTGIDTFPAGPFESVVITPSPATQGQTVTIVVTSNQPVELTATFDGRTVAFVSEGNRHWALIGIHALARPGFYPVRLNTTRLSTQSGITTNSAEKLTSIVAGLYVLAGDFETYDVELGDEKIALLDSTLVQAESNRINRILSQRSVSPLWSGPFVNPLEPRFRRITSVFGERRSYNGGPATSYHAGVDYGAPGGTFVHASAGGTIALAEPLTVRGNAVLIDHGLGVYTGYWHLSEINVSAGSTVQAGDLIGKIGTTGLSTGDHLHWELRVDGIAVNPLQWAEEQLPAGLSTRRLPVTEQTSIQDAFPLFIGSTWTYSVTVNYPGDGARIAWSDLITETIVAGTKRGNAQVFLVQETGAHPERRVPNERRFRYVLIDNRIYQLPGNSLTTPLIQARGVGFEEALRYVWPMTVGDQWSGEEPAGEGSAPAGEVVGLNDVSTFDAQYADCYELVFTMPSGVLTTWFCPGIGVVRKDYRLGETGLAESWQLVAYRIAE